MEWHRINTTLGERELQLMGQPDNFRTQLNRKFANSYENLDAAYWKYGIMIIVILLVPAINLSWIDTYPYASSAGRIRYS